MTDLTPLLFIMALMNKKGFNNIKTAIEAADGFTSKINNMSNMMSMLPKVTGLLNNVNMFNQESASSTANENYVDTLKDIMSVLNSK